MKPTCCEYIQIKPSTLIKRAFGLQTLPLGRIQTVMTTLGSAFTSVDSDSYFHLHILYSHFINW